jgi:hypothetical protein
MPNVCRLTCRGLFEVGHDWYVGRIGVIVVLSVMIIHCPIVFFSEQFHGDQIDVYLFAEEQ